MKLRPDGSSRRSVLIASILFMGLAHILFLKQYIKGLLFAALQVFMITRIPWVITNIRGMITLGEPNPFVPVIYRDHSMFMLIDGVITVAVVFLFLCVYYISVKSALKLYTEYCTNGWRIPIVARQKGLKGFVKFVFDVTLREIRAFRSSLNNSFPILALAPSVLLVMFFIVVPLIFASLVAFTNYSHPHNLPPANTVDWVGLENFRHMFGGHTMWTSALTRVAVWTLVWAFCATVTCYFGGMLMAVIMKEFKIKFSGFFRTIFILPYAVPAIISMLVWRNLLNGSFGAINRTLMHFGIIENIIPWLTDRWLVLFTVVLVNLWAGFPYFMLLAMGSMTAISEDVFEAAKIDGASKFQLFKSVTLPLVIFQTMPLIIMSFTHNINNFGAIFFLTQGHPFVADSPATGATGVDILITWIYRLTMERMWYNYASVLAVMIFVALAPFAIFQFSRTKAFKEGEL